MRHAMEDGFRAVGNRMDTLEGRVVNLEKPKSGSPVKGFAAGALTLLLLLAGCGAFPKAAAAPVPVEPRDATVFIHISGEYSEGYATGWYIATNDEYAVVATAGHVCDAGETYAISAGPARFEVFPDLAQERQAYPFYDHDDPPVDDVCLLVVPGRAPAVLPVAHEYPAPGSAVGYTGWPSGTRGSYTGTVEQVENDGVILLNIPSYFGASGSAVVNADGQVVGILSMGDMRFTNHTWVSGTDAVGRAKVEADALLFQL